MDDSAAAESEVETRQCLSVNTSRSIHATMRTADSTPQAAAANCDPPSHAVTAIAQ